MSKNSAVQIILRVRPHKQIYKGFNLNKEDTKAQFFIAKDKQEGYINNKQEKRSYAFNQTFDVNTKQAEIFDKVAKDVVDSAVEGFNGTIFAYGQTGSGKTFTMTGGYEDYEDRGLIPRTLNYIFTSCKNTSNDVKVTISYLQIYQGTGYDLLQVENVSKKLQNLPRVTPRQGSNGQVKLENCESFICNTEQDALNFLYIGDTNRVVSKTPKNDESTRSHCIFIINLESTKPGSDIKTVATIHLVDLSGSQRIKSTGVDGLLQKQAISINLGLHYLERVITLLNQKAKGNNVHIPYRQSLMTTILKDSIGGNCKTRMIATISPREEDVLQSISTCKFAMRVALIKNDLSRNQTVDPGIIIARLKKENAQLKAEIALLKGEEAKEELDKYDIEDCHNLVNNYIQTEDPSAAIILNDRLKINQCFYFFKNLVRKGGKPILQEKNLNSENRKMERSIVINEEDNSRSSQQIKRLKLLIQQRDNELALLVSLIKKKGGDTKGVVIPVKRTNEEDFLLQSVIHEKPMVFPTEEEVAEKIRNSKHFQSQKMKMEDETGNEISKINHNTSALSNSKNISMGEAEQIQKMLIKPLNLSTEQMLDHAQAFQQFRRSYRKNEAMEKNMSILQDKMKKGKELGKVTNQIRDKIQHLKTKLQNLKRQSAINSLAEGKQIDDPEQQNIRNKILELKQQSKPLVGQLKTIKNEIESIQLLQKKNVEQLKKDFERWALLMQKQRSNITQNIDSTLMTSNIKDKGVQSHLQSFFAARDQIRKR